jgi:hypothetical protein
MLPNLRARSVLIVPPQKKSNPIYLFYKDPTDYDAKGEKDEGAKYYKCYLGN